MVPTAIDVSVTPWAVAPLADPGPQTPVRLPKSPEVGAEAPADGVDEPVPDDDDDDDDELRLQPPAIKTTETLPRVAIRRNRPNVIPLVQTAF